MGSVPLWVVCVSSCIYCELVSVVHPVAILSAVFCVTRIIMFMTFYNQYTYCFRH